MVRVGLLQNEWRRLRFAFKTTIETTQELKEGVRGAEGNSLDGGNVRWSTIGATASAKARWIGGVVKTGWGLQGCRELGGVS